MWLGENLNRFTLQEKIALSVKILGNSFSFDFAESKYDNRIALLPTIVKGERIKLKYYVWNWFLITIYHIK